MRSQKVPCFKVYLVFLFLLSIPLSLLVSSQRPLLRLSFLQGFQVAGEQS